MAGLFLPGEPETLALGAALARCLPEGWDNPALCLQAGLASGKTTLTRGLVEALPGGDQAEVASPSFNLANVYPTTPQVVHVDLFRLGEGLPGADLDEILESLHAGAARLLVVEWAEYLPPGFLPADHLLVRLEEQGDGREATLTANGPWAARWLQRINATSSQSGSS
ncbi:tRNA threonylcarbamoyladenosine biosynthesis protein TsaE [Fundidesulfovibrio magnetotacticus]|uniref:tRNA threonylcarbamoyladenosine biosynthesis protein TsaE n=1 Tax=Fundidesulfovibrio magnetotacticus TaxID=2730080 RepID=A0A6V8LW93_9BACT|nr:tRNA (adenosine(37)-N6)-threonylcarbamoyltransferase complex ATPase subunit type 1 TsaE [Fundidesulfovibrio magnetotacticus]GFK95170.1 tRNA threonylcarbamoyladenosine biosynthesis protein TsaE [Fundidesulfovibrio magnetotacticus]